MKKTNLTALKFTGIIMIVFALIYAIVGTLALMGTINGALPGHESQEVLVVVLAYAVALFAFICGVVCIKGKTGLAKVFGAIFAIVGFGSLVYLQVAQNTFNIVDCMAACFGVSIFCISSKVEKAE
ncbi:MAG TPA: hypothetical protein IAC31_01870 [Candidatus Faecousia intestinigallinarum]|nr:hypothetical protein [Candidatus Faecousia intestinigallinarum]